MAVIITGTPPYCVGRFRFPWAGSRSEAEQPWSGLAPGGGGGAAEPEPPVLAWVEGRAGGTLWTLALVVTTEEALPLQLSFPLGAGYAPQSAPRDGALISTPSSPFVGSYLRRWEKLILWGK